MPLTARDPVGTGPAWKPSVAPVAGDNVGALTLAMKPLTSASSCSAFSLARCLAVLASEGSSSIARFFLASRLLMLFLLTRTLSLLSHPHALPVLIHLPD